MPFLDDSLLSSVRLVILEPLISMSLQFFAYGMHMHLPSLYLAELEVLSAGFYVLLFGMCIRTLIRKEEDSTKRLFMRWSIALFILATLSAGCEMYRFIALAVVQFLSVKNQDLSGVAEYYTRDVTKNVMDGLFFSLLILTNATADSILVYRCYIIWGSRKLVIALPLLAAIAFTLVGLVGMVMTGVGNRDQTIPSNLNLVLKGDTLEAIYVIGSTSVNFLLTLLT
ncbi:hypothetical protein V5O48_018511, partial [Marasmius crinis-equi]